MLVMAKPRPTQSWCDAVLTYGLSWVHRVCGGQRRHGAPSAGEHSG